MVIDTRHDNMTRPLTGFWISWTKSSNRFLLSEPTRFSETFLHVQELLCAHPSRHRIGGFCLHDTGPISFDVHRADFFHLLESSSKSVGLLWSGKNGWGTFHFWFSKFSLRKQMTDLCKNEMIWSCSLLWQVTILRQVRERERAKHKTSRSQRAKVVSRRCPNRVRHERCWFIGLKSNKQCR